MNKRRQRITDFAVVGLDRYELGILPLRHTAGSIFTKGSRHPALSESEQMLCVAAA